MRGASYTASFSIIDTDSCTLGADVCTVHAVDAVEPNTVQMAASWI